MKRNTMFLCLAIVYIFCLLPTTVAFANSASFQLKFSPETNEVRLDGSEFGNREDIAIAVYFSEVSESVPTVSDIDHLFQITSNDDGSFTHSFETSKAVNTSNNIVNGFFYVQIGGDLMDNPYQKTYELNSDGTVSEINEDPEDSTDSNQGGDSNDDEVPDNDNPPDVGSNTDEDTESNEDSNTTTDEDTNQDETNSTNGKSENNKDGADSETLPDTSSNIFNYITLGIFLMLIGALSLFYIRRLKIN